MKYSYTSVSNCGLKRIDNEDAVGIFEVEEGFLVIVCDGIGGNKAGDIASKLTVESIHNSFKKFADTEYLERIKLSIHYANRDIIEKSANDSNLKGMATTAEVFYLKDNTVYWGHVGDSRIYSLENGKLKQVTKDHSLVQKMVDEGILTLKEAENHPKKNIIMRALGKNSNVEIDLSKIVINQNDEQKFFICTDGVTCVVNDSEIGDMLSNNINYIVEQLPVVIEERGAPDNYSFVIIEKIK